MDTQNSPTEELYIGTGKIIASEVKEDGLVHVSVPNTYDSSLEPMVFKYTQQQFDDVKSETPYEDSKISLRKWRRTVAQILQILMDANMAMVDNSFVLSRLRDSISKNYEDAIAKKFDVRNEDDITLKQINDALLP